MKKYLFLISLFLAVALSAGAQEIVLPQDGNLLTIDLDSGQNLEQWLQDSAQRQADLSSLLEESQASFCNYKAKDRRAPWLISLYKSSSHYEETERLELHGVSGFGGTILYEAFPSLDLGIGVDEEDIHSLHSSRLEGVSKSGKMRKIFLSGRLHPQHSFWYIPFGLGAGTLRQEYYETFHGWWYPDEIRSTRKQDKSGLLWFVGLGVEWRLNKFLSVGLEGRYQVLSLEEHDVSSLAGLCALNIRI